MTDEEVRRVNDCKRLIERVLTRFGCKITTTNHYAQRDDSPLVFTNSTVTVVPIAGWTPTVKKPISPNGLYDNEEENP